MIRTPPQYNTINPPGQIVNRIPNLEMPLGRAIEAFKDDQVEGLVRRVQQLEKELKYIRGQNLNLYSELERTKEAHHWACVSQRFWFNAAVEAGWVSDQA